MFDCRASGRKNAVGCYSNNLKSFEEEVRTNTTYVEVLISP
jgi:hypothetical protein